MRRVAGRIPFATRLLRRAFNGLRAIARRRWAIELVWGVWPSVLPGRDPRLLEMPRSRLVDEVRRFWFNNAPGPFVLDGHLITRREIDRHGGPDPQLTDRRSQAIEWLSRVRQADHFEPHDSPQEERCRELCRRQGDERWTHVHQNFHFAIGCDSAIRAPRCLVLLPDHGGLTRFSGRRSLYERFRHPRCDQWNLVLKRRLARACQFEVAAFPDGIDWSRYDLVLTFNTGRIPRFRRPDRPIVLFGHDIWLDDDGYQWVIDWLQPDVLLVPYPTPWRRSFRLPGRTRVVFSPFAPSRFFTRPNLDPARKPIDLLVIGQLRHEARRTWVYGPRNDLDDQVRPLVGRYAIEFSHHVGQARHDAEGATIEEGAAGTVRYLNQWSAYLGSSKFVVFGRLASDVHAFVLGKYYETLASGAIPILPEVPDLALLGVSPFEHYIPLSEIEGRNDRLASYLDRYDEFRPIAENAVRWAETHMDRLLFDEFESLVHELTGRRFPRRLIG